MAEIATLIGAQNKVVPTGSIKVDDNKISVDATDRFKTVDDIGNLVIGASDSGVITRLKDIATITTDVPEDDAYYLYNKQNPRNNRHLPGFGANYHRDLIVVLILLKDQRVKMSVP